MRLRIFIVIENKELRNELAMHLSDAGHVVLAAPEPVLCDAYYGRFCSADAPCGDAMIIGHHLKRMSGLELIEDMSMWGCRGPSVNKLLYADNLTEAEQRLVEKHGCYVVGKSLDMAYIDDWIESVHGRVDPGRKLAELEVFK